VGGGNYCGQKVSGKCVSRPDPGLTPLWVTQMEGQGWGFLPIWVGPQAPCVNATGFGMFTAANAASLGKSNADSAAAAMTRYGLPETVVFYDMENYTSTPGDSCSLAVRAFLTAWVQEINADGFATTAVYGSPGNAQNDFSQIVGLTQAWISITPATGKPPAVTIWGLGAGKSYALSDSLWPQNQRAHQFLTNVGSSAAGFVTYGGVNTGYSIDYDVENLLIPGAEGTKPYIWTGSIIDLSGLVGGGTNGWAVAINDVVIGTTGPAFVTNGQVGQIVGGWGEGEYYGFADNSGKVTSFVDPSGPNFTVVGGFGNDSRAYSAGGLTNASQLVGWYCYGNYKGGPACMQNSTLTESGFVGNLTTGAFSPISLSTTEYTYLSGINDNGQIVALAGQYPLGKLPISKRDADPAIYNVCRRPNRTAVPWTDKRL
jgi:hypothetical protein